MLLIKTFHILFMVIWFAGLFFLPRLFIYHAGSNNASDNSHFKDMERRLYVGVMTPGAILTVMFGMWLISYGFQGIWFPAKLTLVSILVLFHTYCGKLLLDFYHDRNRHGRLFYHFLNWFPALILVAILILTVIKPLRWEFFLMG
jgi:putative membrane protein